MFYFKIVFLKIIWSTKLVVDVLTYVVRVVEFLLYQTRLSKKNSSYHLSKQIIIFLLKKLF